MIDISLFTELDTIAKLLEPYSEKTYKRQGLTYIIPKESPYSEIHITFQPIGLGFEKKYIFVGRLVIADMDHMNERKVQLYRILKGMECELMFKGFIKKRLFFQNRKRLYEFKERFTNIQINPKLAERLNARKDLIETLKNIGVAGTLVILKFTSVHAPEIPEEAVKELTKITDVMEVAYYHNPLDIVWEPAIEAMLSRGPGFTKKVINIYKALNMIGEEIQKISEEEIQKI